MDAPEKASVGAIMSHTPADRAYHIVELLSKGLVELADASQVLDEAQQIVHDLESDYADLPLANILGAVRVATLALATEFETWSRRATHREVQEHASQ